MIVARKSSHNVQYIKNTKLFTLAQKCLIKKPVYQFLRYFIFTAGTSSQGLDVRVPAGLHHIFQNFNHKSFYTHRTDFMGRKRLIGFDLALFQKNYIRYKLTKLQVTKWISNLKKLRSKLSPHPRLLFIYKYLARLPRAALPTNIHKWKSFIIRSTPRPNFRLKIYNSLNKTLLFTSSRSPRYSPPHDITFKLFKNVVGQNKKRNFEGRNLFPLRRKFLSKLEVPFNKLLSPVKIMPALHQRRVDVFNMEGFNTNLFPPQSVKKFNNPTLRPLFIQHPSRVLTRVECNFSLRPQKGVHVKMNSKFLPLQVTQPTELYTYPEYSVQARFFKKFILTNVGLFIVYQNNLLLKQGFSENRSQFKKKLFSFVYPENEKKSIFLRKKKLTLKSILRNLSKNVSLTKNFSYKNLKQSYANSKYLFRQNQFTGEYPASTNYGSSYTDILDAPHHRTKGSDNRYLFTLREVKLARVRFKPGYQKLWRSARSALRESLNLQFQYQKRLTKYISRYYTQVNRYLFASSETSAQNIILYSLLLPDYNSTISFFHKGFFFLNGRSLVSLKQLILPNDFIQIIVSVWYYIAYRWLRNWALTRTQKFQRLVYKKGLASKYQLMKTKKKVSRYTPSWVRNSRYDTTDVKPYLEVDYLTLSLFLLNDPYLILYYSPDNLPDLKLNIYRMYNWKYIT